MRSAPLSLGASAFDPRKKSGLLGNLRLGRSGYNIASRTIWVRAVQLLWIFGLIFLMTCTGLPAQGWIHPELLVPLGAGLVPASKKAGRG